MGKFSKAGGREMPELNTSSYLTWCLLSCSSS